jgi:phospholipid/cholesterol/gamma-HCH transport system ATP-binding protein
MTPLGKFKAKDGPIISIKDVWKKFGDKKILTGLSLDIPKGSVVTMLGFSGTGKSVLLRQILGLMQPDKGEIFVKDQNVVGLREQELRELRQSFGMLFQEVALFDSLNVFDNVAFPLREHRQHLPPEKVSEKVKELLDLVELEPDIFTKMPADLSGGMKKRVGLARCIALDPEILLCDEPTTGLDPVTTYKIDDLIVASQKRFKGTVFMISHDVHAALRISHFVAFLWQGKVIEMGSPEQFVSSRHEIIQEFLSAAGVTEVPK